MIARITQDAWLAELRRLGAKADGGLTTQEWAEKLGLSTKSTIVYLKKALALGWVRRGSKSVESLNGKMVPVSTYIVEAPKGAKKGGGK